MQNIEFKAELRDPDAARCQCEVLLASQVGVLRQTDTYYKLADGRLKRRQAPDEPTEWIYYHRPDSIRPCVSNYSILSDVQAKRRWGSQSLREWVEVVKKRELWMFENIRIHLDEVEQLGWFIEFEAMVSQKHNVKECHASIQSLREAFGPTLGEPVSAGYSDLMAQLLPSSD